jgi:GT2 family glycosyltransferase
MNQESTKSTVSVLVLNWNGKEYLADCLSSLQELDYPRDRHEVVLVDNHSTDGSISHVRERFPGVRVIAHPQNYGFSRGNNLAAKQSDFQYVVFLNADTRVDPAWLRELVQAVSSDEKTVCAGAKILSKDGKTVDFCGSRLNFYGHGLSIDYGAAYEPGKYDHERLLPFACGGSMIIDREVFLSIGGFDEDYFAYFEDVDLGWRLWLMGYQTVFAPRAITYHHHHGHWGKRPAIHRVTLLERNALYTIIKNYQDENLDRILSLALVLAIKRAVVDSELNPDEFHYSFEGLAARRTRASVPKAAFCPLMAVDQLIDNLPRLLEKRRQIQAMRRQSDGEFWAQFAEGMLLPNRTEPPFVAAHSALLRNWPLPSFFEQRACSNLLIICHDTVSQKMAGPAIRYWELAQVLSRHCNVTLAAPGTPMRESEDFQVRGYERMDSDSIAPLIEQSDVVLTFAYMLNELPILQTAGKPLILDLYDPYVLENLETFSALPDREQREKHDAFLAALNHQLVMGDFFVCASERQRHFWLGMLTANQRINPSTYDYDRSLRKLIDVVPFGLPSRPPRHRKQVLKGKWPGIAETDKVVLWGGGIWEWFDPLTLIRAMTKIASARPDVKLFFMGKGHFDPTVAPETDVVGRALKLTKELGVLDSIVFFGDWVPYDERENYLLEADLGVSLHFDHVETRFSFRTRLLDYIWAGLPAVVTEGDYLGDLLAREGLGRSVRCEDVEAVADAIVEMLAVPDLKQELAAGFASLAERFHWESVAQPIVEFCQQPWTAPDRSWLDVDVAQPAVKPPPWWTLPGKAWHYMRRGGPAALWRAAGQYLRWLRVIRRRRSGEGL